MFSKYIKKFEQRHLVSALLLVVVVYIAFDTIGVVRRNFTLQQKVDELSQEISEIKEENQELEYRIAYYQTDAFVEKEAREKLGLKARGEKVIIFPDKIPRTTEAIDNEVAQVHLNFFERVQDNWSQWMFFLFGSEDKEETAE